ncbi:MAG: hypothetical protein M1820_007196 [Bogoriella megaspora]|nr:MAG: hypothetical protein M1820_007196 [Bogoriella megaspora]
MTPNDQSICDRWEVPPGDYVMTLVDAAGTSTLNFTESVGIRTSDVYHFCGPSDMRQEFSGGQLSSGLSGLLFPWVVLLFLLGRQTGARHGDILSALVSVGSPAWICASIFIGVLYGTAIRRRMYHNYPNTRRPGPLDDSNATEAILETFIQDPAPLYTQSGNLWKLCIMPESLKRRVDAANIAIVNRARLDMVFVSSLVAAAVVWILAIIGNFTSLLDPFGSPNSVEWQIGNGMIWLWVFPAAYGSTATRLSHISGLVASIISSASEASDTNTLTSVTGGNGVTTGHEQRDPAPTRPSTTDKELRRNAQMPRWGIFRVEVRDGGTVNYAHSFFTASYVSRMIMNDFQAMAPYSVDSPAHMDRSHPREPSNSSNQVLARQSAGNCGSVDDDYTIELESQNSSPSINSQSETSTSASTREESPDEKSDLHVRISAPDFASMTWTLETNDYIRFGLGHAFGVTLQAATSIPPFSSMYFSPPEVC